MSLFFMFFSKNSHLVLKNGKNRGKTLRWLRLYDNLNIEIRLFLTNVFRIIFGPLKNDIRNAYLFL